VTGGPVVEVLTARIRLRRIETGDVPRWHREVFSDPGVMRYLPSGAPVPLRRTHEVLGRFDGAWTGAGFGPWGVELRATGELVGHCGLRRVEELPGEVEVLYALGRDHWGNGYATEAARASLRYGFERLGLPRILAFAVPANTASRRVMQRLGMGFERRARLFGIDVVVYGLERDAFDPGTGSFEVREGPADVSPRASPRAPGRMAR
jgi:RimJ/RimL family protein N-acetyltransferase